MERVARLIELADFLDQKGLHSGATEIDLTLRKFAADPTDPAEAEVPGKEKATEDTSAPTKESKSEPSMDESIKNDEAEVARARNYFTKQFYKEILDGYTRIKNAINKKKLDYLGEQRTDIIKMSFESLISAVERELKKANTPQTLTPTSSLIYAKMVSNKEIIDDVHSIFTPILDLYEDFERFMATHVDLATMFPITQKNFSNLKNVINNVIKGIPEEIVDIDLTK